VNTDCAGHLSYIQEELQKLQTLKQSYYVKVDGTNQTWITYLGPDLNQLRSTLVLRHFLLSFSVYQASKQAQL